MQPNYQSEINKVIPYDINTILNQLYQYKLFETNIKRVLFFGNQNLNNICLINAYWFNHWKKVSCYHIMKDEIELNVQNNNMNYLSLCLNSAFQSINLIEKFEPLEQKIENNDLKVESESNPHQYCVDWESEFDIISPELWNLFAPNGNINQNTNINLNLEFLSNDSRVVNISDKACYVIFWNIDKQKLGKFILKFEDPQNKMIFLESMKQSSFMDFYKTYLSKIAEGNEDNIQYNEVRIKCLNKTDVDLPRKNPYKSPCGLTNVGFSCYMNAALQSLFNIKKLTNYLLELNYSISNSNYSPILLKAYMKTILNLSRKAEGSKKTKEYAPREFFNAIKSEKEFNELAGDSNDVVRHFFEKIHEQIMIIKHESNSVFSKYILSGPNNDMNASDVQALNTFINGYIGPNKSIIANLFYFLERTITKCQNCNFSSSNFNVQNILVFALEDIKQLKFRKQVINFVRQNNNFGMNNMNMMNNNMNFNNNMNANNNINGNNMINNNIGNNNMVGNNNMNNNVINNNINNNMMNNNMVNNNMMNNNMANNNIMNNNINNNIMENNNININNNMMNNNMNNNNGNNNMMNNPGNNINNNMNLNINNMNMNNNNNFNNGSNNNGRNNIGGMYTPNQMNANMQNPMPNPMPGMQNPMPGMQNPMPGMQNPMPGMQIQTPNMNYNMMMNNNEMMINQIMTMDYNNLSQMFLNIPQPTSITLQDAFENYKKGKYFEGSNTILCQKCGCNCIHVQTNHLYTLPEYFVINLNRGKENMYKVDITFPEIIDLNNEVQTNLDNHNYKLICVVTHLGPHGTGGHYIAYCLLEEKNLWYKFDDSLVTLSSYQEASSSNSLNCREPYILFYHRM